MLIDLSDKLDSEIVVIYSIIAQAAKELDLEFMVVGATSRELILDSAHNIPPLRRTMDIDIGVKVKDWEHLESLKNTLIQTNRFAATKTIQRINFISDRGDYPIDIVPFGEISAPDSIINWPTENDTKMNVMGFEEALENSVSIKLKHEPRLEIKVASLPSQLALKLLAWKDRHADKDAKDIFILASYYGEPVNRERLFEEELEVMQIEDFDIELAGAHLLGKDVGRVSTDELANKIKEILDEEIDENGNQRLVTAMMPYSMEDDFDKKLLLLEKVRVGLG